MTVPVDQSSLRGSTFLLAVTLISTANLAGCAHFCQDAHAREGAWGMVFRCSSRQPSAVPNHERVKTGFVRPNRALKIASLPGYPDEQLPELYFSVDCLDFVDTAFKPTN